MTEQPNDQLVKPPLDCPMAQREGSVAGTPCRWKRRLDGAPISESGTSTLPEEVVPRNGEPSTSTQNSERSNPEVVDERMSVLNRKRAMLWKSLGKKQGIKLGTFNMNGRLDREKRSKWPTLVTLMRKERIGIMAVQETHITDENVAGIQAANPKVTIVHNGNKTNATGVAFVLNNDLVKPSSVTHTILVDGRASRLQICIDEGFGLDLINCYSPNGDGEKADFFLDLKRKIKRIKDLSSPILLGDFNAVLSELDRNPARAECARVERALAGLLASCKWIDGWREHNPSELDFTFYQKSTMSMSRIDRIYTTEELATFSFNWGTIDSAGLSDHWVATTEIMKRFMPYIGKGLWRMGTVLVEDKKYMTLVSDMIIEAQEGITREGIEGRVAQTKWNDMKGSIKKLTQEYNREKQRAVNEKKRRIGQKLTESLKRLRTCMAEEKENIRKEIGEYKKQSQEMSRKNIDKLRQTAKANYMTQGERCTKYWFNLNKEKYKAQIIYGLLDENDKLRKETRDMNRIATRYHEGLQAKPEMNAQRREAIEKIKGKISRKLTDEQIDELDKEITLMEIMKALRQSANGAAPGIDGIPYEFYKKLAEPKKKGETEEKADILGILWAVFKDIEKHGLIANEKSEENHFTDSVMCLLYKKSEKRRVENYRPITLLNTDYKVYTKALTNRLGRIAGDILHENQAGFVPKRSLYDHTRNTHFAIEFCETMEVNGCIVALDQEKAYDKIDHEYLWEVLEEFRFPESFISKVKELYKGTTKRILLNGVLGEHFEVKRGVHQGDPLSCLLYDIAIEPFAECLRTSKLSGIKIDKDGEALLVNLFADDTLVYLGENDDPRALEGTVELFCMASTAKFNLKKTEFLPVGTAEWREQVIENKGFNGYPIPEGTRIVQDGEAMRTLGAWVGNKVKVTDKWRKIIDAQKRILEQWGKCHISYRGKELILKALTQSRAVFSATVDGMEDSVVEEMTGLYKKFLWDGKKALMKWETVIRQRKDGGLNMPDLKKRVEAIELMWIKRWNQGGYRPPWAIMMDKIIFEKAKGKANLESDGESQWVLRDWDTKKGNQSGLPKVIQSMLVTARKYNISFEPKRMSEEVKRELPLRNNILIKGLKHQLGKKASKCLTRNHGVKTLGNLVDVLSVRQDRKKCRKAECKRMARTLEQGLPEYVNPRQGTPESERQHDVEMSCETKQENKKRKHSAICDADYRDDGEMADAIRIGQVEESAKSMTGERFKRRKQMEPEQRQEDGMVMVEQKLVLSVIVIQKEGYENGRAVVLGSLDDTVSMQKVSGPFTRERIQALAIIKAIQMTGTNVPIRIATRSKKAVIMAAKGLTQGEDVNWTNVDHAREWKQVLRLVRGRNAQVTIEHVTKDHALDGQMRIMEQSAKEYLESEADIEDIEDTSEDRWDKRGARLQALTQKIAYSMLIERTAGKATTKTTDRNIMACKDEIEKETGRRPTSEAIWEGVKKIRNPKIGDFVWRMLHQRIRCGPYFDKIAGWEEKQWCICHRQESIDHILCQCTENCNLEMWNWVEEIWNRMYPNIKWVQPTGNIIRGLGAMEILSKENSDVNELYRLMVGSAIWCIWKERNNRIFNEEPPSLNRLKENWIKELKEQAWADNARIRAQKSDKNREKWITKVRKLWCTGGVLTNMVNGQLTNGELLNLKQIIDN